MKKKKAKPALPVRRNPLTERGRRKMLAILIRNPSAFLAVREALTPAKLAASDPGEAFVWKVVCDFFEEHGELPSKSLLQTEIKDTLAANPSPLVEEEEENVQGLVTRAFGKSAEPDIATSQVLCDWAVKRATLFLEDLLSASVQNDVNDAGTVPTDLPAMLHQAHEQAEAIAALKIVQSDLPFPPGWDTAGAPSVFPTGISVFDHFLGGGHMAGEVNVFMGPYGSCKTLVGVMGLVEGARYAASLVTQPDWDGPPPLCVFASYEMPKQDLQERSLSYAARIPRDRVAEAFRSRKGLNYFESKKLLDYEKALFKSQLQGGVKVERERTRVEKATQLLNNHALFLDMTGTDPKRRGAGNGFIPELARSLAQELRLRKNPRLLVVWVDYLGAMAKRHLEASDEDYSELRHRLSGGILLIGNQIGKQFQCPVWVLHQLSGSANARGPAARMHHTDAAEAKNVAENADFAVVTGNLTDKGQLCVFACTKHRRQPPQSELVVKVDGRFSRILDVSEKYFVDPFHRQIQSKEEIEYWNAHALSKTSYGFDSDDTLME